MNHPNSEVLLLQLAKRLYKEEHSFPSVYRKLIQSVDPDTAVTVLNDLKQRLAERQPSLHHQAI